MTTVNEVRTMKKVRSSGTSLMVSITKELGILGLEKDDLVEVILRKVI